jgi:hypothetical protein
MQDRTIPFDVRFAIYTPKPASRMVLLLNLACVQFCLISGHSFWMNRQFIVVFGIPSKVGLTSDHQL